METFSVLDLVGQTIEYKYRILRLLSVDPKGALYEGQLVGHSHRVAVKALFPDIKIKPAGTFAIEHPNIVQIFEAIVTKEHQCFVVTDWPRGKSLKDILERVGKLSPGPAISTTLQLLSALHAIHIHRGLCGNVSPDNIFISLDTEGGVFVSLLDIGVVNVTTVPDNPFYLSPEQVVNEGGIDFRSDIWATGVVLFEMLMGGRPFNGENQDEICSKILLKDPPFPKRTPLPQELISVINHAVAKDVQDRFGSVGAMVGDLLPIHEKFQQPMSPLILQALRDSIPPPPDAAPKEGDPLFDFEGETVVQKKPVPSTFGFLVDDEAASIREDKTAPIAVPTELVNKLNDPALGREFEAEDESELLERLTRPGDFVWGEDEQPPPPVQISRPPTAVLAAQPARLGDKVKKLWFFIRENTILFFRLFASWLRFRRNVYIATGVLATLLILLGAGIFVVLGKGSFRSVGSDAVAPPPTDDIAAIAPFDTETSAGDGAVDEALEPSVDREEDTGSGDALEEDTGSGDALEEDVSSDEDDTETAGELDEKEGFLETEDVPAKKKVQKRRKKRKSRKPKAASPKRTPKKRWASNPFEE